MPKAAFRQQMEWLADAAEVVPLERLFETDSDHLLQVAITFDDGYASLNDFVRPLFAVLGIRATVYLNTARIADGKRTPSNAELGHFPGERFLSWQDVERLAADGWTIGSHGAEHLDLTRVPPDATRRELVGSRKAIEQRLGTECRHFSYTWGRHTRNLRRSAAAAGYRYAATTNHAPLQPDYDPLAIPRVNVAREYSLADFQAIVRGDWDYLGWVQRARGLMR